MDFVKQQNIILKHKDYKRFVDLIYTTSGINLGENKQELMKTRFLKIMRIHNIGSYSDYYSFVTTDKSRNAFSEMIDAISTNHTFFFRESKHFRILQQRLNNIVKHSGSAKPTIRIWCAAASSGEEPYSILISVLETLDPNLWNIKILATDISTRVLKKAIQAEYKADKLKAVSPLLLDKYFVKTDSEGEKKYTVKPEIKKLITFRQFNLMSESFPFKHRFDIVFCRNVMIYFDTQTQQTLISKIISHLKERGCFFIGHSENLPNALRARFTPLGPAAFEKN